ncbi:hypothetical protein GOBAR_AA28543 [Gossypium barbadense]|uniref:Uncharacterized protein n=1 Tax=Gossypium barbadense TaxID=3634 RepID=A0A2P5WM22_GOSBA|nr:hypothetical protein GOBAR_AA28543 [Gossypium barbadense]
MFPLAVFPRALGRTFPDTSGPTFNCGAMHQLATTVMMNYDDPGTVQFRLGSAGTLWPLARPPTILAAPRHQFSHIPEYRLVQSTEEEAYEDIPDDVSPQHEDPPTQPPPPSRPVHAAATSYVGISECLTRFEQYCFQRFANIDATLQQICQHLHISSPVPPREPSSDEDFAWLGPGDALTSAGRKIWVDHGPKRLCAVS